MSVSLLYAAIAIYLFLPLVIFVLGWVTPWLSIPLMIATIAGIYFALKKLFHENKEHKIPITVIEVAIVFVFCVMFCVFLGQGDLFPQDFDWHKHHAIYRDLLYREWPVVYSNDALLTYYLGQYLVPALIGKIFNYSFGVMSFMIPVWNGLGILLVYLFLVYYLKADSKTKKLAIVLGIVFFGGCTNLGQILYKLRGYNVPDMFSGNYKWIDMERVYIHFASNYDAMYGAFQHVITPWLATSFFLGNRKNRESYVLLALPLMFTATFGFVYFAVILIVFAVYDLIKDRDIKGWFMSVFSPGNLLLLPMTAVLLIYLAGNFMGDKPSGVGLKIIPMSEHTDFFLIFVFAEFLAYAFFLFKRNRRNIIFYVAVIELFVMPFISLGMFNDLCSRGSIPARFILMILCLEQILCVAKRDWCYAGVATLLVVAAFNTELQMTSHINRAIMGWNDKSYIVDDYVSFDGYAANPNVREDNAYNYYTLHYSDSIFYKIAKK